MRARTWSAAGVIAGAALLCPALPAHAGDVVGIVPVIDGTAGTTGIATCLAQPSGLSLDPSANPYYIVGVATVVSDKTVVSTALRCKLREHATGHLVGAAQQTAMSGSTTVVAGVVPVSTRGPFDICTEFEVVYADTSQDGSGETCRPVVAV
jgi:hypothetical protein